MIQSCSPSAHYLVYRLHQNVFTFCSRLAIPGPSIFKHLGPITILHIRPFKAALHSSIIHCFDGSESFDSSSCSVAQSPSTKMKGTKLNIAAELLHLSKSQFSSIGRLQPYSSKPWRVVVLAVCAILGMCCTTTGTKVSLLSLITISSVQAQFKQVYTSYCIKSFLHKCHCYTKIKLS